MTFDIRRIAASKAARRKRLAGLPYQEKLRMLDAMRERDALLRNTDRPKRQVPGGGAA